MNTDQVLSRYAVNELKGIRHNKGHISITNKLVATMCSGGIFSTGGSFEKSWLFGSMDGKLGRQLLVQVPVSSPASRSTVLMGTRAGILPLLPRLDSGVGLSTKRLSSYSAVMAGLTEPPLPYSTI